MTNRRNHPHLPCRGLLGVVVAGVLAVSACDATTTTSAPAATAVPTSGPEVQLTTTSVASTTPATTTPATTTPATTTSTTTPATAPPPSPPPTTLPAPAPAPAPTPTTAPPPPPPTTSQPTTTTPAPISVVDPADFFKARHVESGGGLNSQNFWRLDPDNQRVKVGTGHGPLATAEAADVKAMLYTSIQPRSSEATVTWDVSWSGYLDSFVGADSSARARVTLRVYEIIPGSGSSTIGPTVFEFTVADEGVGSAIQGVATLRMDGGDTRSVVLPPLDVHKFYRLEAELRCSSRVAFSIGATVCDFGKEPTSGLKVNDWSIRYDSVPAS